MNVVDLHTHTTFSDGTLTPAQLVEEAHRLGLKAVAVTDHDNPNGYAQAKEAGDRLGVEVIPGIEISTKIERAIHILGYYIRSDSEAASSLLQWIVDDREARNRKMCALMQADGIPVYYEQMREEYGSVIGRPHFGEVLMKLGLADSINDAFDKYIEKGRKYYIPRNIIPMDRAIGLVLDAGGIPVLAHPYQYTNDETKLREIIEYCLQFGLMGMECRYSLYSEEQSLKLERLAEEYHLLKTGGSDFHGDRKPHIHLGRGTEETPLQVPYEWVEELKIRLERT